MDGTWVTWTSALMSMVSTCGAVAALVVTVREGRALRRNTDFLAHRDQWWKRWSWVVDRAFSLPARDRAAASIMAEALATRDWTTDDDTYMFDVVRGHSPGPIPEEDDDLETQRS